MKVLLVAGGSGGHLIPALTLAEYLRQKQPCVILSTARPIDRIVAAASHVEWETVDLQKFTPLWRWFFPGYALRQCGAMKGVWRVLRRTRPDVVVGFGGYLSAVGIMAARLSGVPAVVHEQNLLPGRANRLLALVADAVGVSFPETKRYLPRRAVVEVTGNPVRSALKMQDPAEARRFFGFDPALPVLLIMGGSQGSRAVNALSLGMWEDLSPEIRRNFQVLHLTGQAEAVAVERAYKNLGVKARVCGFLHEMETAYSAATLAVSRAGATTISEMIALRVPAIFIPYPHAGGHQKANAGWLQQRGAAVFLDEEGMTSRKLWSEIEALLSAPGRLEKMRESLGACSDGSSVERLGALVSKVAVRHAHRERETAARPESEKSARRESKTPARPEHVKERL